MLSFGWRKIPSADVVNNDFSRWLGLTRVGDLPLYLSQHLIASKSNEIDQQRPVLSVEGRCRPRSTNRAVPGADNAIWDDAGDGPDLRPQTDQKMAAMTPGDRASKSITRTTAPLS